MSISGISSSILSALDGSRSHQSRSQQIQTAFQQLSQDLQSGNLTQAQSDFTTLSKDLPGLSQNSAASTAATTTATTTPTVTTNSNNSVAQAFAQLGQDLQAGNLSAAQQDFTNVQQDVQQASSQHVGGHHHHHAEHSHDSSASSQTNPIDQAFSQLSQTLQSGNLQGAQTAFTTLQNDLQQIGGFYQSGSSTAASSATAGSLNVSA